MNMASFEIWSLANSEGLNIDRDMDMDRRRGMDGHQLNRLTDLIRTR
jgi:hypothetical protein